MGHSPICSTPSVRRSSRRYSALANLPTRAQAIPTSASTRRKQVQRSRPREGQVPERGVIEVKAANDDAWITAAGDQASRYWGRYRLVLVTNSRDFVLIGEDAAGRPAKLETFRLAVSADDFGRKLERPRAFAREVGARLGEYLTRALSHRAALAEPKDLAWLLASYARDGHCQSNWLGPTLLGPCYPGFGH